MDARVSVRISATASVLVGCLLASPPCPFSLSQSSLPSIACLFRDHYPHHLHLHLHLHPQDLPPQIGRCNFLPAAAPYTAEIDGGAWSVAVAAADCLEPMLPADPAEACRDAARQCIANHAKVGGGYRRQGRR